MKSLIRVLQTGFLFCIAAAHVARAQRPVENSAPRILFSALTGGDFRLGRAIADSVQRIISRTLPAKSFVFLPARDIDKTLDAGDPELPLQVADLGELAKQLHVTVMIDVVADSTASGVRVTASRIVPPNGIREIRSIEGRDRSSAARLLATELATELSRSNVAPEAPCARSNLLRHETLDRQPIYLLKGPERLHPHPAGDSLSPSARFIVDSAGWVIPESFRMDPWIDRGFVDAARLAARTWQFLPALSDLCPIAAQVSLPVGR